MPNVTPWLWFDTEGEEAADFYTSVFPNSKIVEVTRYGSANPQQEGAVMTVTFDLDGQQISVLNGGPQYKFNEAVSFMVECADQAEVDYYWNALSEGGEQGGPVRMAEGPLRAVVADRAEGAAGAPGRP